MSLLKTKKVNNSICLLRNLIVLKLIVVRLKVVGRNPVAENNLILNCRNCLKNKLKQMLTRKLSESKSYKLKTKACHVSKLKWQVRKLIRETTKI